MAVDWQIVMRRVHGPFGFVPGDLIAFRNYGLAVSHAYNTATLERLVNSLNRGGFPDAV